MGRSERPLEAAAHPLAAFAAELRRLRNAAGSPKYLQMARKTGRSRTALAEAAGGDHLPTWETVAAYVTACGGDLGEWRQRWEATREAVQAGSGARRDKPDAPGAETGAAAPRRDAPVGPPPLGGPAAEQPERPAGRRSAGRRALAAVGVAALAAGLTTAALAFRSPADRPPEQPGPVVVRVQNKVAIGPTALIEDRTPVFLSSRPVAYCRKRGCVVAGTDTIWTGALLPAVCHVRGEVITNADLTSDGIDRNPARASSDLWYKVELATGASGYVPEAYLAAEDRGGKGLPTCDP